MRDFCVFWVLGAARGKFTETLVGIKVVYDKYKHFRSALEIAVSRDFCVFWVLEAARGKFKEKQDKRCVWHICI